MKLKQFTVKKISRLKVIRLTPKRHKLFLKLGLILVIILVISAMVWQKNHMNSTDSKVNCEQTEEKAKNIYQPDTSKYVNPADLRKDYETIKQPAQTCQDKIAKSNPKLETLTYNYTMAVNAYKFGDTDAAHKFADTTLELNDTVDDASRKDTIPTVADLKIQMEAVKDGKY